MEQRQMRLVNLIKYWSFLLFCFSSRCSISKSRWPLHGEQGFCSEGAKQIKMASAWEAEGLILTDVSFCQKQLHYYSDNSVFVILS